MRPRTPSIFAVLLAALAIAGCGGGGDDDSTAAAPPATVETIPTLSKEELIAQGDAICAEVNAAVGTVGSGTETSSATIQVADIYAGMVDNLEDLGTPEEETGYAEFIEAARALSQAEDEAKLADEREDVAALEEAEGKVATSLESFQSAAAAYGFESCSEGPSAPVAPIGESSGEEEVAPEEVEVPEEEVAPEVEEEVAPETGGAGGEAAPEGGGTGTEAGGGTSGGGSGGVGPG